MPLTVFMRKNWASTSANSSSPNPIGEPAWKCRQPHPFQRHRYRGGGFRGSPHPQKRNRRRNGRLQNGPPRPTDVPSPAKTHRLHQQNQLYRFLYQPTAGKNRRHVRQSRNHHRWKRPEILRLCSLDIRRSTQIKSGDAGDGSKTRVKVVKNEVAPPFPYNRV